jgi:hypothetical protein
MDHRQRKSGGDRRIHGVAALMQNLHAHLRSLRMDADHHCLAGVDWPKGLRVAHLGRRQAADN